MGRLVLSGTLTLDPMVEPLQFWLRSLGMDWRVELAPYNQVFQQLLDPNSASRRTGGGANVLVVCLSDWAPTSDGYAAAALQSIGVEFLEALRLASSTSDASWLVFFTPPSPWLDAATKAAVDETEAQLVAAAARLPGVYALSSSALLAYYPVGELHLARKAIVGDVRYAGGYYIALATMAARWTHLLNRPPYKVVAVDCDDTLWTGICGEVGPGAVQIDSGRQALQRRLVELSEQGFLLVICSKNNEVDVQAVFQRKDMVLRPEHITAWKVNWRPKSENLRAVAKELSLGLDSFVFLDDSAMECSEVAESCPQVLCHRVPSSERLPAFIQHLWALDRLKVNDEDRRRGQMYRENAERERVREGAADLSEFIRRLELRVEISPLADSQLGRASELTLRTNQFNLRGIRRSEAELRQLFSAPDTQVYQVSVADRFGDYGLVGVIAALTKESHLEVDTFLLSCRALGRGVETQMLGFLRALARDKGRKRVQLPLVRTERNTPAVQFLESSAFAERVKDDGVEHYWYPAAD